MRELVLLRTISKNNAATNMWIQHLVNTIIIQLDLPQGMQAKPLHETFQKNNI
ncbi:hypothetical protein [Virgibacillus halodenitrificans]|uniref:hypothetical protein n=1 Tax=Virgibacillus halodenitrificans TaxID=1482 RepID=UPI0013CF2966|nr:hypothetical protein [Virgibacillus halodenitrificans]